MGKKSERREQRTAAAKERDAAQRLERERQEQAQRQAMLRQEEERRAAAAAQTQAEEPQPSRPEAPPVVLTRPGAPRRHGMHRALLAMALLGLGGPAGPED